MRKPLPKYVSLISLPSSYSKHFFFHQELQGKYPNLKVCPLYATLPQHQQMEAFSSAPGGTRKVILSTNIGNGSVSRFPLP